MALCLTLAAPAAAHQGHDSLIVVDGVSPAAAGVEVRAVPDAVGKIRLTTTGSTTVEVLSRSRQPILRIGPGGVDANAAAPDWYAVNEPLGIAQVPPAAKRGASARWIRVAATRSWEWFDHRFHPAGKPVYKWRIPLRVDGERADVRGRVTAGAGNLEVRPATTGLPQGLSVSGISGPMPAVRVRNDGNAVASVLGPDGEVFARIGPKGAEVNVKSSVWLPTAQTRNRSLLEAVIDPSARPRFVLISPAPELIWPDPRIVPRASRLTGADGSPRELSKWSLPIRIAGRDKPVILAGATVLAPAKGESVPPSEPRETSKTAAASANSGGSSDDGRPTAILLAVAGATALLIGAVLAVRRRGART